MFWKKKTIEPQYTLQLVLNDQSGVWAIEYQDDSDFASAALEVLKTRYSKGGFYPTKDELDADLEYSVEKIEKRYGSEDTEDSIIAESDDDIIKLSNLFQRRSALEDIRASYDEDMEFITNLEYLISETSDEEKPLTEEQKETALRLFNSRTEFPGEGYEVHDKFGMVIESYNFSESVEAQS